MIEIDAEALEAAAKKVREIRMSDGDSFGTLLYATDYCAGPTAGDPTGNTPQPQDSIEDAGGVGES